MVMDLVTGQLGRGDVARGDAVEPPRGVAGQGPFADLAVHQGVATDMSKCLRGCSPKSLFSSEQPRDQW